MNGDYCLSTENNELSLEANLAALIEEKIKYRSQEKYKEANVISEKIKKLKEKIQKKKLSQLKSSHNEEKQMVEQSFEEEVHQFESYWNSEIKLFKEKCDNEIENMISKHTLKVKKLKEKLMEEIMVSFKPSPGLLNIMKCKEQAVKQEKFVEAQSLHSQIEAIRYDEEQRYKDLKKTTIDQHLANYKMDFEKKLQYLKKKHNGKLDEIILKKKEDYNIITKKYENLKRELENNQNIRVNIHEGKHTTAAGRHYQSPNKSMQSTLSPFRQKSLIYK